jgi:hypothetical protein
MSHLTTAEIASSLTANGYDSVEVVDCSADEPTDSDRAEVADFFTVTSTDLAEDDARCDAALVEQFGDGDCYL